MTEAYVFEAIRTPRGAAKETGALHAVKPVSLVAGLLRAIAERTRIDPARVEDLILGCSTAYGDQGGNIAKTALLFAGWPESVSGMTVNRYCISGLEAVAVAAAKVASRAAELVLAGGVESMSRVPMMADRASWFADPEIARATRFVHMGIAADLIATLDGRTREELDDVAVRSHARAAAAAREGRFARSIVPVRDAAGDVVLDRDETVREGLTKEKVARLPPAFVDIGAAGHDAVALAAHPEAAAIAHLHTVATSPAMVDGASLVLVGTLEAGRALGLAPRARVVSYATCSSDPVVMLGSPAPATRKALARARRDVEDVGLFEHNESFAATMLRYERELGLDPERVNPNGGALALGHPLGATGGILVGALLDEMDRRQVETGVVALCAGAGLGAAMVLARS